MFVWEGDKTQKNKSYKIITDYPNMLTNTAWDVRDALGKENVCMLYCRFETKLSLPLITRKVLVFVFFPYMGSSSNFEVVKRSTTL